VLKGHPEIAVLRIDVRGKDLSKAATEERGRVIVDFLVKGGIAASKLKVTGLGAGPNRVEMVVEARTKPKRAPIPQAAAAPEPTASVDLGATPEPEPAQPLPTVDVGDTASEPEPLPGDETTTPPAASK
jgi:hypothetical protein